MSMSEFATKDLLSILSEEEGTYRYERLRDTEVDVFKARALHLSLGNRSSKERESISPIDGASC